MTFKSISPVTCNNGLTGPGLTDICTASTFFIFMSLIDTLIRSSVKISGTCRRVKPIETPDEVYDFVVIGGGATGAIVAARLSEILKWKVLLLEAGPDEPPATQIPSYVSLFLNSSIAWNYTMRNESHACRILGQCPWSSGRNLGGNTVHNGMIYTRGNPTDYNNWAAQGNEGWTWEEVKKFYLKAEDNGEIDRVGKFHHGTGGPLSVERFPHLPAMGHSILAAAEEAGFGVSEDLNGDKLTGFSVVQATNKHGVRRSSSRAYLWPARHRKNLHISLNSYATRLIIENNRSIGVEYYKNDSFRRVYVTREVIVSGGAVRSPHLLLVSGIGPKEHLESKEIEVVNDLPGVGENFHDHVNTILIFEINEPNIFDNNYVVATRYLTKQTGPMSSTGLSQVVGILASNVTTLDYPDIELFVEGYRATCAPGPINVTATNAGRMISILPVFLHPKSRGRISLTSKDPFVDPVLWANYMGDPSDVRGVVDAIKMSLKLVDTKAMRPYNFTLSTLVWQGCSNLEDNSDEYWACAAQQFTVSLYHHVGSCKMGPASDPMAVVDPRLRVYGIKGLRIADASIMPQITSGSTGAPSMMIGERAADFIKKDWGPGM